MSLESSFTGGGRGAESCSHRLMMSPTTFSTFSMALTFTGTMALHQTHKTTAFLPQNLRDCTVVTLPQDAE